MKISVVVPAHLAGESLERCLQGLTQAQPAPDELIVVPDGKAEGVAELARSYGACVLEPTKVPMGPAHARNRGVAAVSGDVVFFVDADVVVHPDVIHRVRTIFEEDADLAALIGSYDDDPGERSFLSRYRNLLHHFIHQTSNEDASTFWGACGAIRRDIFLKLGGFDERYVNPSIEDIELGYRLKQAGYRIRLCKTLLVKHLKHWNARDILVTDFFYRALPWADLIMRRKKLSNDLNLRHEYRISAVIVYLLLLSLVVAIWWPTALVVSLLAGVVLVVLNAQLYRFFRAKCGLGFAMLSVFWHWLYYFYSALAFGIGTAKHLLHKLPVFQKRVHSLR